MDATFINKKINPPIIRIHKPKLNRIIKDGNEVEIHHGEEFI